MCASSFSGYLLLRTGHCVVFVSALRCMCGTVSACPASFDYGLYFAMLL